MSFRYTKYKIKFTHLWLKLLLLAFLLLEAQTTAANLCKIQSFTFGVSPVGISHTLEPSFSISPKFSIENTLQYGRCQYHPAPYNHTVHYHSIYQYSSDLQSPTTACLQQVLMSSFFFGTFAFVWVCLMSSAFLFVLMFSLVFLLQFRVLFCHI